MAVPARDRKGSRTGFTTGACAAAAAKAAARCVVLGHKLSQIETSLPNRQRVTFVLERCESDGNEAVCSIIKDAGDDPDCTHGAELVAHVRCLESEGIEIRGGDGVATVTKPGLGLDVGTAAVNPVPRKNIAEMVNEELAESEFGGAVVTISVPGGLEMTKHTTNDRLGLIGGISILGTTGIVRPYSTAAFKASVVQEIDVATQCGQRELVLTTGGKSEKYAMEMYPSLDAQAFIQVGDFIGVGIRHCARRNVDRAIIVGMMGKLSKMANGKMQTHVAGSKVDLGFLASLASEVGASDELVEKISEANTARHVLELCKEAKVMGITSLICQRVVEVTQDHAKKPLAVQVHLVDFAGELLGEFGRGALCEEQIS